MKVMMVVYALLYVVTWNIKALKFMLAAVFLHFGIVLCWMVDQIIFEFISNTCLYLLLDLLIENSFLLILQP